MDAERSGVQKTLEAKEADFEKLRDVTRVREVSELLPRKKEFEDCRENLLKEQERFEEKIHNEKEKIE